MRAFQKLLAAALLTTPRPTLAQGLFEQAVGGDLDSQSDTSPAAQNGGLELGGYVRGDLFVGKTPDVDASEVKAGFGEAALTARVRAGDWGDAFGELRLASGMQWGQSSTEASLREAYVNLYLGRVDLRFGKQIVVWGRADAFNPTDNVTPRDMNVRSANPDDRRLGNLAARAWLSVAPIRLEAIWVPFFAASRFPELELPGPIERGETNEPDQNLTKGIGALRLNIEGAAFEGSVSYLVGHATFPGVELRHYQLSPMAPPTVVVGFSAYRHQVVGVDFATTLNDLVGLRGEAAYRRPFDYETRRDVPLPDLQVVLGIDREVLTNVTLIAQYIGRYVFDWEEIPEYPLPEDIASLDPAELRRFLYRVDEIIPNEVRRQLLVVHGQQQQVSHAASVRLSWTTLHETLTLEVVGYTSFTNQDFLVQPKVTYAIADALTVAAGGEIYGGPDETLFGLVDEVLSAGFVELKASF